mmetsp:Transcript_150820/g.420384  ORF Transcript_150820/g.420384 Transcript_150820/m.420384 type:complete len:247 (+) Transcript_150820:85-825(+)
MRSKRFASLCCELAPAAGPPLAAPPGGAGGPGPPRSKSSRLFPAGPAAGGNGGAGAAAAGAGAAAGAEGAAGAPGLSSESRSELPAAGFAAPAAAAGAAVGWSKLSKSLLAAGGSALVGSAPAFFFMLFISSMKTGLKRSCNRGMFRENQSSLYSLWKSRIHCHIARCSASGDGGGPRISCVSSQSTRSFFMTSVQVFWDCEDGDAEARPTPSKVPLEDSSGVPDWSCSLVFLSFRLSFTGRGVFR